MSSRADTNDYDALGRDVLAASSSGGGAGGKGAEVGEVSSGVQRLLAAINLPVDTPRGARWGNLDPVYRHPETGAKAFVGNATAAKSKELLLEHSITRVVNCKDPDDPCWHKDDPDFEYLRFPIAYHWRVLGGKANDKQAILEYFGKLFDCQSGVQLAWLTTPTTAYTSPCLPRPSGTGTCRMMSWPMRRGGAITPCLVT